MYQPPPVPRLRPGARVASIVGALLTGGGVLLAVVGAFFQASSQPWLQPTPQVLEIAAACKAKPSRRDQDDCLRTLVARRTGDGAGRDQMAKAQPADR
jgi:hypothetical protein